MRGCVSVQEESHEQSGLMKIAHLKFLLSRPDDIVAADEKRSIQQQLMALIEADHMAPYYSYLVNRFSWTADDQLVARLEAENSTRLAELDGRMAEAEKNAGDSEVREAMWHKAEYLYRIGDKERAVVAYEACFGKTVGSSSRIDVVLALVRLGLAFGDNVLLAAQVERAKLLVEAGGDWERKNLLAVYEAVYLIITRKFKEAATLLLDAIPTFTAYELFPYTQLVFYAGVLSIVSVDRPTLKKRVLTSPEILSTIDSVPHLRPYLFSLYRTHYADFFHSLADIAPALLRDQYLSAHVTYYLREIRIVAYNQFLESYRTATLTSMAAAFGVHRDFMDAELFRFIGAGRVNAKIDAVQGVVETNRPDDKQQQYDKLVQAGDALLNRIQNLTRVVNY